MALKQTVSQLRSYLDQLTQDLTKAENGNKAASQRVRTGSIRFEKIAKLFRKESIKEERANKGKKRPAKAAAAKKPVKAAGAKKSMPATKSAGKTAGKKAVAPKKGKKATSGSRPFTVKRTQTAKLPAKRTSR